MSNLKRNGLLRWSPSYLRRQGQITKAQRRYLREFWSLYGLTFVHGEQLDLGREPVALEIGFGMGENLIARALANPQIPFVGIEVHKPALANTLSEIHSRELQNLKLIRGDARLVLADHLAGKPLRSVHLLFPDPWPKERDAHRRFVQPELVDLIADRLIPGGQFQVATDADFYGVHVANIMAEADGWEEVDVEARSVITRYEGKGQEAGREIWERAYRYC